MKLLIPVTKDVIGSGVFASPSLILGIGFLCHTSLDPTILGKYSAGYAVFLCAWLLLVVPLSYALGRYLFDTHTLQSSRGRCAVVGPRTKLAILAVVTALVWPFADRFITEQIQRSVTVSGDSVHPFLQNSPPTNNATIHTNRWGFRGDDFDRRKPPGEYRIFMLGGSTVYCGRLKWKDTHAAVLQRALQTRRPDRNVIVQNAGADWHTTQHSLFKFLVNIQDFNPDLIIVCHGINDVMRSFTPQLFGEGKFRSDYGHYFGASASWYQPRKNRWALIHIRFGHCFSDFRFDQARVISPYADTTADGVMFFPKSQEVEIAEWSSLPVFQRNLTELASIALSKRIGVVLATQPSLYRTDLSTRERQCLWMPLCNQQNGTRPSVASMSRAMRQFNAATREVANTCGTHFVNLDASVPKANRYFVDGVHYTPAACQRIAASLRDYLVRSVLPVD